MKTLPPAIACAAVLAGCGSSASHSTSGGTTGVSTPSRASQQIQFAQCMRRHGVPISDPANGAISALRSGAPPQTLQPAIAACRQYAVGSLSTISAQQREQFTQAFLRYAVCLRAHGVNVPDPGESGGSGFGQKLLAASTLPGFKTANATCRRTLPFQFGGAAAG